MYVLRKGRKGRTKFWVLAAVSVILLLVIGVVVLRSWYSYNLRPVSSISTSQYFTVVSGSSVQQIAERLQRADLIRSSRAFATYVRSNEYHDDLQAGTYTLSPSMSVEQIVKKMVEGDVTKNLLTILPAKRLDQIKEGFSKAGYTPVQIDAAFDPSPHRGHSALESLPAGASLEGYLYPDSFQKLSETPPEVIVRQSLDEMQKHLTSDIKSGFAAQGLSVFQGITLASLILQETDNPKDQLTVSQVFYLRLKRDMPLQSDPTAFYAAALAGVPKSLSIDSPYNTYLHKGLTPGPIGNVTEDALIAAAHPAGSDYLYFVAGDDGKVYFTHTQEAHNEAIRQHCQKKCGNL